MFTALTLTLALGAPVPPPVAPVAAGVAPKVMELKADANGKITVTVMRKEMQKVPGAAGGGIVPNGGVAPAPPAIEREVAVIRMMTVELGDVRDLAITTADGKKLEKDEAVKKLEKGGVVVVSTDGNPVSPAFLKVFKDETLVLVAKELAGPTGFTRPVRPLPVGPGGIQIQPVNPRQGIQIQIQPGAIPFDGPVLFPAAPAPDKK